MKCKKCVVFAEIVRVVKDTQKVYSEAHEINRLSEYGVGSLRAFDQVVRALEKFGVKFSEEDGQKNVAETISVE